jgi:tetratricopeptide (TPR) repeat protein
MTGNELLNKAKTYFDNKEYDNAEEIFQQLLNNEDNNFKKDIYCYLGEIYDKGEKDYSTAIEYYKKALNYDLTEKEKTRINYLIGLLYTLSTDYLDPKKEQKEIEELEKQAIPYFKKALNKEYKDYYIESSIQLSLCYFSLEKFQLAIEVLNKLNYLSLIEEKQREVNGVFGACYFGLEEYNKSTSYFKNIDESIIDSSLIKSKFLLGYIYYFKGKTLEAIKEEVEVIYYENQNSNLNTDYRDSAYSLINDALNDIFPDNIKTELINNIKNNIKIYILFKKMGGIFMKNNFILSSLKCYKIALTKYFKEKWKN